MTPADMQPQVPACNEVVRVATNNNFNCTEKEWAQLDLFAQMYPQRYFFINTNIKTPKLATINEHPYQAVITANPDLVVDPSLVKRLSTVEPSKVAFVRVKWLPDTPEHADLIEDLLEEAHDVVITLQRWNGKKTLGEYTSLEHYKHSCSKYRLCGEALQQVHDYVDELVEQGHSVYICDRKDLGCGGCGLCARLTLGKAAKISSLNLSSSGICPYSCPDCYAKTMQHMNRCFGHQPIAYDVIKQNAKQAGKTKHIKNAKKAARKTH